MKTYDCIIIGGGTGGLRLAVRTSKQGKKVLLIDPQTLGGTCLNNGCIPTKALLEAAHRYVDLKKAKEFGVLLDNPRFDFKKIMKRVNGIVNQGVTNIYTGIEKNKNITVLKTSAKFVDKKVVEADGKKYTAEHIIISTGAKNFIPPIKGLEKVKYYTNENMLKLKELPKKLILLGGGYISMEFAFFFASLGTKVTVLERAPKCLGVLDDDLHDEIMETYESLGININTNANIENCSGTKGRYTVTYSDLTKPKEKAKKVTADTIFLATGRVANTLDLNLEATGIKPGPRHEVPVNNKMETKVKGIYAIGDVTGRTMFAHAVKRQAEVLLHNWQQTNAKKKRVMNFDLVPWTVFTTPNISGIGLNERQCEAQNINFETLYAPMKKAGRTKIIGEQDGFVKVMYEKKTRKILGAGIIGAHADDLIHEVAVIMNSKDPTIDVLQETIHVHPTVAEVFSELK